MSILLRCVRVFVTTFVFCCTGSLAVAQEPSTQSKDPLPAEVVLRIGKSMFSHGHDSQAVFNPDGKTLVSVSRNCYSARIWDLATGKLKQDLLLGTKDMYYSAFAISKDCKRVAAAITNPMAAEKSEEAMIRIWDLQSGDVIQTIRYNQPIWQRTSKIEFLPDGKTLVASLHEGLAFWEIETGIELLRYKFSQPSPVFAVSSDGKTIAVAETDNTGSRVLLWSWESKKEPRKLERGDRRQLIAAMTFSPDGKRLAFVSNLMSAPEIWDTTTGQKLITISDKSNIRQLAFSPDGTKLLASEMSKKDAKNQSGGIVIWDAQTGKLDSELSTPGDNANSLSVSADGKYVAGGTQHGISVWDLSTKKEMGAGQLAHRKAAVIVSGMGTILTYSDDHTAKLWESTTGKLKQTFLHSNWIRSADLSPDGTKVATSSLDDEVAVWDSASGKKIFKLQGHGQLGGRRAVRITPDGKRLISFGDDFSLRVCDLSNGKMIREYPIRPKGMNIADENSSTLDRRRAMMDMMTQGGFAISDDGSRLAVSSKDHYALYDTDTGKETITLPVSSHSFSTPAFSPDGKYLLTFGLSPAVEIKSSDGVPRYRRSDDASYTMWDLSTGKPVYQKTATLHLVAGAAFRPDGKIFAAKMIKDRIGFFDSATGQLLGELANPIGFANIYFSLDGKRLNASMTDTSILVYNVPDLKKP